MFLTSYIFKSKAVRALKGNWQTALIVAFIAGLPATINMVLTSTQMPVLQSMYQLTTLEGMLDYIELIPIQTAWLLLITRIVFFVITPVLVVGSNFYFIQRIQGQELGVIGVLSRRKLFLRALWLSVIMSVRVMLWGLLFIIPGYIAILRYSMAPYFLAENPDITASEAIRKSKQVMADKKFSYFMLKLSFVGWLVMVYAVQMMLIVASPILGMVASQFLDLFRITYMSASIAAFYLAASRTEGIQKAKQEADEFVKEISGNRYGGFDAKTDDKNDETDDSQTPDSPDNTDKEA